MNYNPFSPFSQQDIQRGGIFGEIPSFMTTTGTPSGFRSTSQFGTMGLSPSTAAAAQKQEFERRSGLQQLETGGMQQRMLGFQLQSEADKRAVEEAKRVMRYDPYGYLSMPNMPTWARIAAQRELELENLGVEQARAEAARAKFESGFYGGGGFSSWATPAFPMMGR